MQEKLNELKTILAEVDDLSRAIAIASWDLEAYMPPGGTEARGHVNATLSRISQETFTSEKVGKLLDDLLPYAAEIDKDSDDARIITETNRQYDKLVKVPSEMISERAQLRAVGNQAWREAREKSDFSIFQPHLEKMLDWVQRYGELFKPYDHIYDPLLDDYEAGMKTADVQQIFDTIRPQQVELIEAIAQAEQVDDSFLYQAFEEDKQRQFGREVVEAFGFDFNRGREDKVTHPFATNLGYGDQRITVRMGDDFFNPYLFGALHEAGHGMYEQGIAKELARTSLYGGTSLGIHESQSRLWEILVGRSKPFWDHYYPRLQELFPSQLGNVASGDFYKGINIVKPSFIRVEADEATTTCTSCCAWRSRSLCWKVHWLLKICQIIGTASSKIILELLQPMMLMACCKMCIGPLAVWLFCHLRTRQPDFRAVVGQDQRRCPRPGSQR